MVDARLNSPENPYESPSGVPKRGYPRRAGSFLIDRHVVDVYWSQWTGLEVYVVDGEEVLRVRSFELRGARNFRAGDRDVEIRIDGWPSWKMILKPWIWVVQAYVDGELAVEDVTPELRRRLRRAMLPLQFIGCVVPAMMVIVGLLVATVAILRLDGSW